MYKCPRCADIKAIKKSKEVLELEELELSENDNP
jgi:phage FluMu protein Com